MADQLKRLGGGFAYQTAGTGLTATSNTGGLLSGGNIATIYTAPAATSVVIRDVVITCWAGSNAPDNFVIVYYRFSNLSTWNYKFFTSTMTSAGRTKWRDNGLYVMNAGDTLQVLIQAGASLPANPLLPTVNGSNNSNMYENIGFLCYGVEAK